MNRGLLTSSAIILAITAINIFCTPEANAAEANTPSYLTQEITTIDVTVTDRVTYHVPAETNTAEITPATVTNNLNAVPVVVKGIQASATSGHHLEAYNTDISTYAADSRHFTIGYANQDLKDGVTLSNEITAQNSSTFTFAGKSTIYTSDITAASNTNMANIVFTISLKGAGEVSYTCVPATEETLHVSQCPNTSDAGCYGAGYRANGSKGTTEIVYGTVIENGTPKAGDAFDCNINGDGTYERFYYISDDGNKASMLYSDTFGLENDKPKAGIQLSPYFDVAETALPTSEQWSKATVLADGKAGRFMTHSDINAMCGISSLIASNGSLSNCDYVMEKTRFESVDYRSGIWLAKNGNNFYRIHTKNRSMESKTNASENLIKPVAEIPLSQISFGGSDSGTSSSDEIVEHNTNTTAVNNYFANVTSWNTSESDFLAAIKNNFESNSCNVITTSDSAITNYASGNVVCDRPVDYDTGTTDSIKVYLSNEQTKIKGDEATYVTVNNGKITNMIPGQTYRWESISDPNTYGYVKATGKRRFINIDGIRVVRDLGGLAVDLDGNGTPDAHIQYGRLIRGERLWSSQANVNALMKLGINEEFDLTGAELSSDIRMDHVVAMDTIHYAIDKPTYPSNYDKTRATVKRMMEDIIDGKNIYFHCRQGADRTGTVAYILEGLLGVDNEDRYEDYELTNLSGIVDRTRYYRQKTSTNNIKFVYMMNFLSNTSDVYSWYMAGTTDEDADIALINQFKLAVTE